MYESEVNKLRETKDQIPEDVLRQFAESANTITHRTVLPWSEHCTECVWPTCYTTCEFYDPRQDDRCRRFVDGMVRIDDIDGILGYLIKIRFKRWGKIWAEGNVHLFSRDDADTLEKRDRLFARGIQAIPTKWAQKRFSLNRYNDKKRWSRELLPAKVMPSYFLFECFNPRPRTIELTFEIKAVNGSPPYLKRIDVPTGFCRERIDFTDIVKTIDISQKIQLALIPNDIPEGTTLYFGTMDFVFDPDYEKTHRIERRNRWKCVVWDLDNTLWQGTLIEDGPDGLTLRPGIMEVIEKLDQRGILHSIASKNNHDDAMRVLDRFGLEDYFLYPQISWDPKSTAIDRIAAALNIGRETIVTIDDSPFERAEIEANHPEVSTIDAAEYAALLERREFDVDVTQDARQRRRYYQNQVVREETQNDYAGDYLQFLRDSQIRLTIRSLNNDNLARVHELTQRTNQMNFSGNRYHLGALQDIRDSDHLATYVLDCEDRFGKYGTVGFCIVDMSVPRMLDLMFSCRIQGRRVEHAFLTHVLNRYKGPSTPAFHSNYVKTAQNTPAAKVFDDFGFVSLETTSGVTNLAFSYNAEIPDDAFVEVTDHTERV